MVIQELYDSLFYGNLRQVYLNSEGALDIQDCHKREIAILIQNTLREIYSERLLAIGSCTIEGNGNSSYSLSVDGLRDQFNPEGYITAVTGAKIEDLIKIIKIISDTGSELLEGFWNDPKSFYITNYRTVMVPKDRVNTNFTVQFQATHPKLNIEDCISSPETVWIDLPYSYAPIICLGVTAKKMSTTGIGNGRRKSVEFFQEYQQALSEMMIKNKGISIPDIDTQNIRDGGYL